MCAHNTMVATGESAFVWKCAECDYIYGKGEKTMDPDECLRRIVAAQDALDFDEFRAACSDLATWLKKGGFAPVAKTPDEVRVYSEVRAAMEKGDLP